MSERYIDLFDLLEEDPEAEEFYLELPEYVREFIEDRADSVRSLDDLRNCAKNFLGR